MNGPVHRAGKKHRMSHHLPKKTTARRGATTVEVALVLGPLLLFLIAMYDYTRYVMARHILDNAAREGARLAVAANVSDTNSFNYQTTTTLTTAITADLASQSGAVTGLSIQIYLADANGNNIGTWTNATTGQNIAVEIDGTYAQMSPGFTLPIYHQWISLFPNTMPLTTKAVMRTESN